MAAATAEKGSSKILEDVFQNVQKAAEANLKMQQEVFRQWTSLWPAIPTPQSVWLDKVRDFQKQWAHTFSDLVRKHRETLDRQYQAAIESMDAALRVPESTNPEEFRRRSEQLCRKTLECMKEMSESQMRELQETLNKWTELVTKAGT